VFKLLPTSLLVLSFMLATPAAANPVPGGHLYIQDVNKDIVLTYGGLDGNLQFFSTNSHVVFIGTIDANGNFVDHFTQLFMSQGSPSGSATLVLGSSTLPVVGNSNDHSFIYNASAGAVELVFMWHDWDGKNEFGSDVLMSGPPATYTQVTYSDRGQQAEINLWDLGGASNLSGLTISALNVGATSPYLTTPAIPEPETYAMMLAGLGLIGVVARRRKNR